jgi:uncharacterized protein (TIGR02001 family)
MVRLLPLFSAAAFAALLAGPALSDPAVITADETASPEKIQSAIDVAFGAAVTSNYIFRGITQSDNKPAFQAYMEATYGIFYAGAWGSSVDFGDDNTGELDLSAGIRPEFGKLSLDLGYVRYLYNADGDCCGEAYAKADFAATDSFTFGGEMFQDFTAKTTYLRAKASYALPQDFELSGGFGTFAQFKQHDWDVGVSKTFADVATLDLRYYGYKDDVETTHKFGVSVSFDTSLSALRGK